MMKKFDTMTEDQAEKIFGIHVDGGTFEFPYYRAYHENGVGSITQSFRCHLLEGDKEMLMDEFGITEKEWNEIPNPDVIQSYTAIFPNGKKMFRTKSWKIKKQMQIQFGIHPKEARRKKTSWIAIAENHGIVVTKNTVKKY